MEQTKNKVEPFDDEFIQSLISMAHEIAVLNNISIIIQDKESAENLLISQQEIRKVYQNIISNAVDLSPENTLLKLDFKVIDGIKYVVSLADSGKGFGAESLKKQNKSSSRKIKLGMINIMA